MSEVKNLLAKMINKINSSEDRIENIEENGVGGVSSWNDLTDKPFYSEIGTVELLPETETTFLTTMTGIANVFGLPDTVGGLEIGSTYAVTYNGINYNCVAKEFVADDVAFIVLGNQKVYADMGLLPDAIITNEPFLIMIIPPEHIASMGQGVGIYALDFAETATIAIVGMGEVVHPLDAKYLPDIDNTFVRIDINEDDSGNLIASKTYDEITDIILSGKMPYCVYRHITFYLTASSATADISTFAVSDYHIFSSLEISKFSAYSYGIEIFKPDIVHLYEHNIVVEDNLPEDAIKKLINEQLGVIENGTY